MKSNVPPSTKQLITDQISAIFERLKHRLLYPLYSLPPEFQEKFKHDKLLTMPGLYMSAYATSNPDQKPGKEALKALARVTENYVEEAKQRATERAVSEIDNALSQASSDPGYSYEKELNEALLRIFDQAQGETKKVIETELHRAKTIGLQEGMIDALEKQGVDDPTIIAWVRLDQYTCEFCKDFFLLDDGVTPRAYKLSELKSGYLNKKNPEPVLPPVHPNCFLGNEGRVLTDKGWRQIKDVGIGDMVLTHKLQFKKVVNTLNWDMTLYRRDYYTVQTNDNAQELAVTPDHQFWTTGGLKAVKDIDPNKDELIKLTQNCVFCSNRMDIQSPKLFCSPRCRDSFLGNSQQNVHKLTDVKYEAESFRPIGMIRHVKESEPMFLHDITVEDDESFFIDGVSTKNCRCLISHIPENYGFVNGNLQYISKDYDLYEDQKSKGLHKSLTDEFAIHECPDHHKIGY